MRHSWVWAIVWILTTMLPGPRAWAEEAPYQADARETPMGPTPTASAQANQPLPPAAPSWKPPAVPSKLSSATASARSWWTPVGSLALVLVVVLVLAALLRRFRVAGRASGGSGGLEVLQRVHLEPKQALYVIRWGRRLILAAVGPSGASPLSECIDSEEVEVMLEMYRQSRPALRRSIFRSVDPTGPPGEMRRSNGSHRSENRGRAIAGNVGTKAHGPRDGNDPQNRTQVPMRERYTSPTA